MVNENELRALARKWQETAMSQVPVEYAERGLHGKYFRLDNEASGLDSCASELLELLDRAAELPLEPTTGQDFSSAASDEIKIQIRLGRNNHLVKEETCPRNAGRINIYLPDDIVSIENSEKS